jgi:hypothetical protein
MHIAFNEWVRTSLNFVLDTSEETTWTNGQIGGPRNIPVLLEG